jgi:hypothetical protein
LRLRPSSAADNSTRNDLLKLIGLIAVAIVVSGGLMIWATAHGGKSCRAVNRRLIAPDSAAEALVWHYGCGLVARGMVGVNVRVGRDSSVRSAQVMTAMDTSVAHMLHGGFRPPRMEVAWRAGDTLDVGYDPAATLVRRDSQVGPVTIRYHALPPIDSAGAIAPSPDGE